MTDLYLADTDNEYTPVSDFTVSGDVASVLVGEELIQINSDWSLLA